MPLQHKKPILAGLGASLFHIFCCGVPLLLFFFGIQAMNVYLYLDNKKVALWIFAALTVILALFLNYRKMAREESRTRQEKSLYLFSLLTSGTLAALLYLSYTSAPYVLPLVKNP